ncbi:hypothetical protein Ahia01_000948000 [Argonauta hians]
MKFTNTLITMRSQYYTVLVLLLMLCHVNEGLYYANSKAKGNYPRLGKRTGRLYSDHSYGLTHHQHHYYTTRVFHDKLIDNNNDDDNNNDSESQRPYSVLENLDRHRLQRSRLLQSIRDRILERININ